MHHTQVQRLETMDNFKLLINQNCTADHFANKDLIIALAQTKMGMAKKKVEELLKTMILSQEIHETLNNEIYVNGFSYKHE